MNQEAPPRPTSVGEEIRQNRPLRSPTHEALLALLRTADDVRRSLVKLLQAEDITPQQYNVLRILRGAAPEGLPTLQIAERMLERTPGVTRLIDRMELKGLVERKRCTEDRRRVWCRITEQGLALLARLDEPMARADEALFSVLDEDELRALVDSLDRIRAALAERTGGD